MDGCKVGRREGMTCERRGGLLVCTSTAQYVYSTVQYVTADWHWTRHCVRGEYKEVGGKGTKWEKGYCTILLHAMYSTVQQKKDT